MRTSILWKIDIVFVIYKYHHVASTITPTLILNLFLPQHCNTSVFLATVLLPWCCNPFSLSTCYQSSIHDAVNSSLFFEPKLSLSRFLLFLLRFLKVSPKSKLILTHITFSLLVLFWINLSCLFCVVWLEANIVRNLYLHNTL